MSEVTNVKVYKLLSDKEITAYNKKHVYVYTFEMEKLATCVEFVNKVKMICDTKLKKLTLKFYSHDEFFDGELCLVGDFNLQMETLKSLVVNAYNSKEDRPFTCVEMRSIIMAGESVLKTLVKTRCNISDALLTKIIETFEYFWVKYLKENVYYVD